MRYRYPSRLIPSFGIRTIVDEYLDGEIPDTMGGLIEAAQGITEASGGTVAGAVMRGIRSHTIMDTVTGMVLNNWGEAEMSLPYNVWFDGDWVQSHPHR